jgi:hypothetical protein
MVRVCNVELACLGVELEAQWTPALVLPARVLRPSATVQSAFGASTISFSNIIQNNKLINFPSKKYRKMQCI